jgi:hypothetical protein
VGAL